MREKWGTVAIVVVLVLAWGGGFLWFRGDLHFSSGKPHASAKSSTSPSATPSPSASPSAPGVTETQPSTSSAFTGTVTPRQERQPVDINPAVARPRPRALAPVADWTMATFNLLGSSHTGRGGDEAARASGPNRMNGALQILAQHQISVVGFQEFQPNQRAAFNARAKGWQMWPGLQLGGRAGENSVAWRTDTWDMVKTELTPIPYFNGRIRPMPYVLLRNKATGVQAWFSTFHNPADVRQFQHQQKHRTEATTREIKLVNDLTATGVPVFVTGDMNERADYFCRMTGESPLIAAAGGSHQGSCSPPTPTQIDWIFGSPQVTFDQYVIDRSPLVRHTTDHPVVVTHVILDAIRFKHAFVPVPPTAP